MREAPDWKSIAFSYFVRYTACMPSRNIVKLYVEGGYYHVYNRGVEKRDIFLDEQDYLTFIKYFQSFLSNDKLFGGGARPRVNLSNKVQLAAYCLMPNHFHLLIHQDSLDGMTELLHRAMTGYVGYFNRKYGRVGGLFQDEFKAVLVDTDEYLMHVSRYIHLNPLGIRENIWQYPYSSLRSYSVDSSSWLKPKFILDLVGGTQAYRAFVNDLELNSREIIGTLALE